ncbi:MAG: hypothetical protein A3A82_00265 [Candidatus Pacebacteria bacterium RIFCSPLOWO2_01_FULL_47_12]|nr:MAG: hypothetical protein A3J60_03060 [Candidatus Pacebacteria bacterium RIFCSPHIGHO2_02_FULL_46_9]OGJ39225.1 MAG: hypothetical protein A3A82_00265 [Candidatus Pacebacteria bacterium RIFCSPLOWO2_01_FULL_47_12]
MLFALYSFSRVFRQAVLMSVFGTAIPCKHTPTCGELTLQAIQTKNMCAFFQAGKQFITCF